MHDYCGIQLHNITSSAASNEKVFHNPMNNFVDRFYFSTGDFFHSPCGLRFIPEISRPITPAFFHMGKKMVQSLIRTAP